MEHKKNNRVLWERAARLHSASCKNTQTVLQRSQNKKLAALINSMLILIARSTKNTEPPNFHRVNSIDSNLAHSPVNKEEFTKTTPQDCSTAISTSKAHKIIWYRWNDRCISEYVADVVFGCLSQALLIAYGFLSAYAFTPPAPSLSPLQKGHLLNESLS